MAATCERPETLMVDVMSSGQSFSEGSVITFQCKKGPIPNEQMVSTCIAQGETRVWVPDPNSLVCAPLAGK